LSYNVNISSGIAGSRLLSPWIGMPIAALLLLAFVSVVTAGVAQAKQARFDLATLGDSTWRCRMLQSKLLRDDCLQQPGLLGRPVARLEPQR